MKSIVISVNSINHVCTFSVTKGAIVTISSGGCDAAHVLRRANAILTGTTHEILASVEAAFNHDLCTAEDDLYRAELLETFESTIIESGNGLPYTGDLVYSGETNMVYRIATCSRVQVNGLGKGNSVEVTLIEAGCPDDYSEAAFGNILDCQVDLLLEVD